MSIGLWIIALTFGLVGVMLIAGYMDRGHDITDIESDDDFYNGGL